MGTNFIACISNSPPRSVGIVIPSTEEMRYECGKPVNSFVDITVRCGVRDYRNIPKQVFTARGISRHRDPLVHFPFERFKRL